MALPRRPNTQPERRWGRIPTRKMQAALYHARQRRLARLEGEAPAEGVLRADSTTVTVDTTAHTVDEDE